MSPIAVDVENLSAKRQYRLNAPIAPHLCGASRRITLDDEKLRLFRALRLAVGEFPREGHAVERPFAEDRILRRLRGLPRLHGERYLAEDGARVVRVLFEESGECLAKDRFRRSTRLDP